jgi:type IV pilus assembly protein PilW
MNARTVLVVGTRHRGMSLVELMLAANMTSPVASMRVASSCGVRANDLVMLSSNAGACTLRRVTGVNTSTTPHTLAAATTASTNFNPSAAPTGWISYTTAAASRVFVLGELTQRSYSIDTSTDLLRARGLLDASDRPVAADIVDLQAQYGITASAADDTVTQWVDADAAPWNNPGPAERKRIKAIRVAVVARTAESDASNPGNATIVLWPAVAAGAGQQSTARTFTPTGDAQRHRYRVLRTVVPLKNLLWSNLT